MALVAVVVFVVVLCGRAVWHTMTCRRAGMAESLARGRVALRDVIAVLRHPSGKCPPDQ